METRNDKMRVESNPCQLEEIIMSRGFYNRLGRVVG